MVFRLKQIFLIPFFACLIFVSSVYTTIDLTNNDLFAQDNEDEEVATTVVERRTAVFINKEFIEILEVIDSTDDLMTDATITATIDDIDKVTINVLDPSDDDEIKEEGRVLVTKARENGKKAFLIKGVSPGSTTITFEVINNEDESSPITEVLSVEVIDLEAVILPQKDDKNSRVGPSPFTVEFFDESLGTIDDTRIWDFGDGSIKNNEENPMHTYGNSGIFDVNLKVSQSTSFGTVTDSASTSICVLRGELAPPGDVFGTVFDPINNTPLNRVQVVLITGSGEQEDITNRNGTFRFTNVTPGTITFSICKRPFAAYECILEDVQYNGGQLNKNFELVRKETEEETEEGDEN